MHYNPLAGQLIYIQETMDTSNFDWPAANRMVETSRCRGTLIFFICAGVLSLVSILRLLQYVDVRCGTVPPQDCQRILPGLAWRSMAVFLLTEAGAAVSLLAFCFWQQDFSNSFEKQKQSASDLGFLSTAVASSASAAFCMRVVLCWIGPVMINFSLSSSAVLSAASVWKARGAINPSLNSWILGMLLIQQTTILILSIAYFHSGYASAALLWSLIVATGFELCLLEMSDRYDM
ncbi:unnamed protein product [Effrenium voratum]|uniref:Uncharacterized protein n=1 Tax=Effrenium voratum TaxID=2562239 RepID=A0AA36HNG0_9DINO|nr:unnamed protein product [Effrenium voratum]